MRDIRKITDTVGEIKHHQHLTDLRDKFAMAALTGILASPRELDDPVEYQTAALMVYGFADAMLTERKRERPPKA